MMARKTFWQNMYTHVLLLLQFLRAVRARNNPGKICTHIVCPVQRADHSVLSAAYLFGRILSAFLTVCVLRALSRLLFHSRALFYNTDMQAKALVHFSLFQEKRVDNPRVVRHGSLPCR